MNTLHLTCSVTDFSLTEAKLEFGNLWNVSCSCTCTTVCGAL